MTDQEIKETAKLMEEGNLDLVDYFERTSDELMQSLGFTKRMDETEQNEVAPISGTITFLKGNSFEKAEEHYRKKQGKE